MSNVSSQRNESPTAGRYYLVSGQQAEVYFVLFNAFLGRFQTRPPHSWELDAQLKYGNLDPDSLALESGFFSCGLLSSSSFAD